MPYRTPVAQGALTTVPLQSEAAIIETTLELRGLTRNFGDRLAVDRLTLSVGAGRMFGFLGPNGAGKTTTMRMVVGILEPDSGTVTWRGRRIDDAVRRRFGYMPEERGLYPRMRVRDHIVYVARLYGLGAQPAARSADLWLERLGITDRGKDRIDALSHGNRQRVQLATALVHDPDLLVLDEPFSGLDPVAVETLAAVLRERARQGATVVFSSHQLDLVEDLCEDVAIIDAGRLVVHGPVAELKRRSGRRRLLVRVAGGDDAWARVIAGVRAESTDARGTRLVLGEGVDPGSVLRAAQAAGEVKQFSHELPTLTEIFLQAVRR